MKSQIDWEVNPGLIFSILKRGRRRRRYFKEFNMVLSCRTWAWQSCNQAWTRQVICCTSKPRSRLTEWMQAEALGLRYPVPLMFATWKVTNSLCVVNKPQHLTGHTVHHLLLNVISTYDTCHSALKFKHDFLLSQISTKCSNALMYSPDGSFRVRTLFHHVGLWERQGRCFAFSRSEHLKKTLTAVLNIHVTRERKGHGSFQT